MHCRYGKQPIRLVQFQADAIAPGSIINLLVLLICGSREAGRSGLVVVSRLCSMHDLDVVHNLRCVRV